MLWREKLVLLLATWFGVGHLPFMPGTWGSLAALPLWWLLQPLGLMGYGLAVVFLAAGSIWVSGRAESYLQQADAPVIVIDEVVGQLITLAGCSGTLFEVGMGLALFRLFDISKPFPIGLINDRVGGGLGIVLDDVLAGIYAGIILAVLRRLIF